MAADRMLVAFGWVRRYATFPANRSRPVKQCGLLPTSGTRNSQFTTLDNKATNQTYLWITYAEERIAEEFNDVREDHKRKKTASPDNGEGRIIS